jgi:hypothetical protein
MTAPTQTARVSQRLLEAASPRRYRMEVMSFPLLSVGPRVLIWTLGRIWHSLPSVNPYHI